MPVVSRGEMNNGYGDFVQGHLRSSSYVNGYDPPYRKDDYSDYPSPRRSYMGDMPATSRSYGGDYARSARSDIYTNRSTRDGAMRRHNGVDDIEGHSFEMRDGREPTFEVDHLATYTSKSGTTHPEDGLSKLKTMESSTGIWTMRCMLIVERRHIVVIDKGNGDELERFPLSHVHEPTAVLKNDRRETYNNLVLFTILDDPRRKNCPSDMHIFQSVTAPAHDIVDEILSAKGEGAGKRGPYNESSRNIPPPPSGPAPEPPYASGKFSSYRETHAPGYRGDSPIETRLQETRIEDNRIAESGRFNDASRWIHDYYTSTPVQRRSPSPSREWDRDVNTIGYNATPELYNNLTYGETFNNNKQSIGVKTGKGKTKGGNQFGTWSGGSFYEPDKGTLGRSTTGRKGKKGKKWYKFGFTGSKSTMKKVKSSKENRGVTEYSSATLPLSKSASVGNLYTSSMRRRNKSEADIEPARDWPLESSWGIDMVDTGRGYGASRGVDNFRASYFPRDDMDTGQNEALERDVQLLNNCFDDIEKFVSRLQQAAEAYKELERRRGERGGKKNKKPYAGDGMLQMRARPPPAEDFVDIFQKFKFAFNLLAKLKAHIHDPNAPELVHFLFTPLSLIYEASRDPIHGGRDLGSEAVAPLLLHDAKQLLLNCLTSKELELWQRLGKPWTLVKDEWPGYVPPYNPRFYNGWQPSPQLVDEVNQAARDEPLRTSERAPFIGRSSRRDEDPYRREDPYVLRESRADPYSRSGRDGLRNTGRDEYRDDYASRNDYRRTNDEYRMENYQRPPSPEPVRAYEKSRSSAREPIPPPPKTRAEENQAFGQELKRMGATIYEALHERQGKNAKELDVEKGDIVQVLDKSRNWWKLKNYKNETGYAPYTILKEYQPRDDFDNNQTGGGGRLSGEYSSYINGGAPPPAPPPMAGSGRAGSRAGDTDRQPAPPTERQVRPIAPPTADQRQQRPVAPPPADFRQQQRPVAPPIDQRQLRPNQQPRLHGEKSMYSHDLHTELRNTINTSDERPFTGSGDSPRARHPSDERSYNSGNNYQRGRHSSEDSSPRESPYRESPPVSPRSPKHNVGLSQYSTSEETRDWVESKGFTRRCMDLLNGYNGLDLFNLDKRELERLLGRDEGRHLDSLLTVQRNNAGYRTRGQSELRAILQRRKERSDTHGSAEDNFGSRPSFMPETPPDYSPPESEASSDDFGDAGKTLRNLLERQRKKLHQGGYNGPYQ